MVDRKTPAQIEAMHRAGQVAARALAAMQEVAEVGANLLDLDAAARKVLADAHATSPFLNYHPRWAPSPFPGVVCLSVNDQIVHGIPTSRVLTDGDVVSADFGVTLDGWCADTAITFIVGTPRPADVRLVTATREALEAGIAAAQPGARIGDIGAAVMRVARHYRFGILADHGGHGIGRQMHMDPFVPNEGRRGHGEKLFEGMTIAIEPMLIADGRSAYVQDSDGWTLRTPSGARAAHFEHTVAITADGPVVLTTL